MYGYEYKYICYIRYDKYIYIYICIRSIQEDQVRYTFVKTKPNDGLVILNILTSNNTKNTPSHC